MRIAIKNCRLAFPDIWRARPGQDGGKPTFGASLIIPKDHPAVAQIRAGIEAVAKEKWADKAQALLTGLIKQDRVCLHDGDRARHYDRAYTRPYVRPYYARPAYVPRTVYYTPAPVYYYPEPTYYAPAPAYYGGYYGGGATVGGALRLNRVGEHKLDLRMRVELVEPTTATDPNDIPFLELATVGGSRDLRGFASGRGRDLSAIAVMLSR